MANAALREEVDTLRNYMMELSYQSMRTDMAVARLAEEMSEFKGEMSEFKDEMSEFKDEMSEFKDEMSVFKDEMSGFKDEMSGFKDEMSGFKDEMREFKDETRHERRHMNKQWGDLANRLGTLVEDIVAPNLPRIAKELLACDVPDLFAVRVVRRFGGETREYDAMLVCGDVVLINETKSRLLDTHVDAILDKAAEFPQVYPEYAGKRTVAVLASLYPDDSVVRCATRRGVLVMGMGEETMVVLNPTAIEGSFGGVFRT